MSESSSRDKSKKSGRRDKRSSTTRSDKQRNKSRKRSSRKLLHSDDSNDSSDGNGAVDKSQQQSDAEEESKQTTTSSAPSKAKKNSSLHSDDEDDDWKRSDEEGAVAISIDNDDLDEADPLLLFEEHYLLTDSNSDESESSDGDSDTAARAGTFVLSKKAQTFAEREFNPGFFELKASKTQSNTLASAEKFSKPSALRCEIKLTFVFPQRSVDFANKPPLDKLLYGFELGAAASKSWPCPLCKAFWCVLRCLG